MGTVMRRAGFVHTAFVLVKQGVIRPLRPDVLLRIARAWRRWGLSPALAFAAGAVRHADRAAVIDERGALSYAEIDQRTTRLANALRDRVPRGTRIGVLCRNYHGPVETVIAAAKLGIDVVLLNTGLSTQQLADVLTEQRVGLLVVDAEFRDRLPAQPDALDVVLAWTDGPTRHATLEHLIATGSARQPRRPPRQSRLVVLTSGTTGAPKGAQRPDPPGLGPAAAILSRVPLRAGERMLVCAPLFHTWGLAAFQLGSVLGATLVLRRRFDPEQALAAVQRHHCTSMFAVPVMLQRLLELPAEIHDRYDHSTLRIVASSGSALPADLATRFQRAFGPVLHNLYGSTEVSWVSIATPQDLRAAPGTVGRPPPGTTVRILDEHGQEVGRGRTGRIFAGNDMLFSGYTSGGSRETRDGLMSTGDLGRFDHAGRLFVVGREDDMIVSGGENVYPKETEDAIAGLPEVSDAAVIGVDDAEFGQRLAAFVVLRPGRQLDAEQLRERVRDRVSKYAVPRDVVFLDELPRNATGKVVPRELLARLRT
ncbi:fatty-acyl-CoA synthase [Saccharopolyspora subtropica]|uniref:AMP-binding protein n=1 Tax=Saccharopolyspora thermophila TaxID=89367 RepID=A0A917K799_9PSEU|nr:AMP-binding protein [Saccharopolyspora subtropica]GGJ02490.1 fatty-acyl-CoA synthase [Saccharopolyspora subtropica]